MEISSGRNATAKMKEIQINKKMSSQSLWHLLYYFCVVSIFLLIHQ